MNNKIFSVFKGLDSGTFIESVTFSGAPKVENVHVRIETSVEPINSNKCRLLKTAYVEYRKNTWGVKAKSRTPTPTLTLTLTSNAPRK